MTLNVSGEATKRSFKVMATKYSRESLVRYQAVQITISEMMRKCLDCSFRSLCMETDYIIELTVGRWFPQSCLAESTYDSLYIPGLSRTVVGRLFYLMSI